MLKDKSELLNWESYEELSTSDTVKFIIVDLFTKVIMPVAIIVSTLILITGKK